MLHVNNYYFIDGSSLLGDIAEYNKKNKSIKKLSYQKFLSYFTGDKFRTLHGGAYKRFSIYFVCGEDRAIRYIQWPNKKDPNNLDMEIKYCGKKLPKSSKVDTWIRESNPPKYVLDRFNKSEKGVDIQICSDILQLAGSGRVDRILLYTNDSDFIPLCTTAKLLGCNISLFRLFSKDINEDLLNNVDTFSSIPNDNVHQFFVD